jgi:hypothetical protein
MEQRKDNVVGCVRGRPIVTSPDSGQGNLIHQTYNEVD